MRKVVAGFLMLIMVLGLSGCVIINIGTGSNASSKSDSPTSAAKSEQKADLVSAPTIEPTAEPMGISSDGGETTAPDQTDVSDAKPYIVFDNLCWSSVGEDAEQNPDFEIIDRTHLAVFFPGWPNFSALNVYVENASADNPQYVPVDQQDDIVVSWNGEKAVIAVTNKAKEGHYAVQFGGEVYAYALIIDFVYARNGESVKATTPVWDGIPLALFTGARYGECYLAASEDGFFLSTENTHMTSHFTYEGDLLSIDNYYIDASDRTAPKPTSELSLAGVLKVEAEDLIQDGMSYDIITIKCDDLYFAVNEKGEIVFTADRQLRALWFFE